MRDFIKATTGLLTCISLALILVLTGVVIVLLFDATHLDRVAWIYALLLLNVLCNGTVYALLDRTDKRLT